MFPVYNLYKLVLNNWLNQTLRNIKNKYTILACKLNFNTNLALFQPLFHQILLVLLQHGPAELNRLVLVQLVLVEQNAEKLLNRTGSGAGQGGRLMELLNGDRRAQNSLYYFRRCNQIRDSVVFQNLSIPGVPWQPPWPPRCSSAGWTACWTSGQTGLRHQAGCTERPASVPSPGFAW